MDGSIADETLTQYVTFSERDTLADFRQGQADGGRDYPPEHQSTFSAHEMSRISEARAALNRYTRRLRESHDEIEQKITERRLERDTDYGSRKDSFIGGKTAAQAEQRILMGPSSREWGRLAQDYGETERLYQENEFRAGRPPSMSMHQPIFRSGWVLAKWITVYTVLLSLLAILEVPVNDLAVRYVFEFAPPVSYLVAFLIGTTFVFTAHFLGIELLRTFAPAPKTATPQRSGNRLWHGLAAVVLIIIGLMMIYVLYQMRGQVADLQSNVLLPVTGTPAAAAPPQGILAGIWQGLVNLLPWTGDGGPGSSKYAQFGLLLLNLIVFLAGTVLSLYRHDADGKLEHAWTQKFAAQWEFDRYRRRYEEAMARTERDYADRIQVVQRRADTVEGEISRLEHEKDRLLRQTNNDMRLVLDGVVQQISAYQKGNMETRTSRPPAYFGHAGLLNLSDTLLIR